MSKDHKNKSITELDMEFINLCFKENWLHIRHLETQRMTVFSALVAFFAVAIYNAEKFINTEDGLIAATVLMLISICISIVALLLTVKWNRTFDSHMVKIKNIINDYNKSFHKSYSKYIQYTDHTDDSVVKRITSMPRTGNLFVTVYIMIMTFLTFRLIQIQSSFLTDASGHIKQLFIDSSFGGSLKVFGFLILVPIFIVFCRLIILIFNRLINYIINRTTHLLHKAENGYNNRKKDKGNNNKNASF